MPANIDTTELLTQALQQSSPRAIALRLGLNVNTVKRWIVQARVPALYTRDLLRILGRDAGCGGDERDKDQFYTNDDAAAECLRRFREVARALRVDLRRYTFIEPAAGGGAFFRKLPRARRIGVDIDPACEGVLAADYLTWHPRARGEYIVIGNPPFGLRGHLALQFINHSFAFADMVAFILPPMFNSDGKGVPAKRVAGYQLAHTSPLAANSFSYPDGTPVEVRAIFQVWTRAGVEHIETPRAQTCKTFIRVYSLSDGGTPASTRNKAMLHACDLYLPSTCFNNMRAYRRFEDLPHRRGYGVVIHRRKRELQKFLHATDWGRVAFRSTNGALNLRTSLIEKEVLRRGFYDCAQVTRGN